MASDNQDPQQSPSPRSWPSSDLKKQLSELRQGHIHIPVLNIDYDVPDEVKSTHHWLNRIFVWVGASLLGLVAVLMSVFADGAMEAFQQVTQRYPWSPFLMTPLGFLAIRHLGRKYFSGAEGSGIPQVIASLQPECLKADQLLSWRVGIGKLIGTTLGLLCGASIGREGPSVQLGAIVLKSFGRFLRAPILYSPRSLVLAGGAAGVSAAFNTPIAGIVFAIEELGKSFYEKETSVLLMAIVVSGMTALSISGQYYYFGVATASLSGMDLAYAVPVGVVGGAFGGFFSWAVVRGTKKMDQLAGRPLYLWVTLFGLGVALLGYISGGATFGTGYEQARNLLSHPAGLTAFPISKILATLLSYFSGIPGGIFSPTLSIGAGIGSSLAHFFETPHYQSFVLLGMAAFFSGVIRSPITAVIIVSEMTHNHSLLFPLLLAALSSYGTSFLVQKESLYMALARRYLP